MTIKEMVKEAHGNSRDHGWWPQLAGWEEVVRNGREPLVTDASVPEKLMLIVTEVAEAMEDYRRNAMVETFKENGKPCGFPSELADIVIRVGDLCGALGIDLEGAIERKMKHNRGREYRHGGKLA